MKKKGVFEAFLIPLIRLILIIFFFLVLLFQLPNLQAWNTMAKWAAQGIRNDVITVSTTEAGFMYYHLYILGIEEPEFNISIDYENISAKHYKAADEYWYSFPHYTDNLYPSKSNGDSFCIVKTFDDDCKPIVKVCAAGESCCKVDPSGCFMMVYSPPSAPAVITAAVGTSTTTLKAGETKTLMTASGYTITATADSTGTTVTLTISPCTNTASGACSKSGKSGDTVYFDTDGDGKNDVEATIS